MAKRLYNRHIIQRRASSPSQVEQPCCHRPGYGAARLGVGGKAANGAAHRAAGLRHHGIAVALEIGAFIDHRVAGQREQLGEIDGARDIAA